MRLGADPDASYRRQERKRRLQLVAMGIFVIIVLFVTAAFIYTWYIGQRQAAADVPTLPAQDPSPRFTEPQKPTDKSQIGVAVQSFVSPVQPGQNTQLGIKTLPGAACSILFIYDESRVIADDTGLIPQTADDYGLVDWTWTVDPGVPDGEWPVEVNCAYNGKSAYYRANLVVQRPASNVP